MSEQPEYITTEDLAKRWLVSEHTVRFWRQQKKGPPCFQPRGARGKALYLLTVIEEWESRFTSDNEGTQEE